jgi:hypothetical protein
MAAAGRTARPSIPSSAPRAARRDPRGSAWCVGVLTHEDAEGRAILADGLMVRFVRVQDTDYDLIRAMVARAVTAGFLELR